MTWADRVRRGIQITGAIYERGSWREKLPTEVPLRLGFHGDPVGTATLTLDENGDVQVTAQVTNGSVMPFMDHMEAYSIGWFTPTVKRGKLVALAREWDQGDHRVTPQDIYRLVADAPPSPEPVKLTAGQWESLKAQIPTKTWLPGTEPNPLSGTPVEIVETVEESTPYLKGWTL